MKRSVILPLASILAILIITLIAIPIMRDQNESPGNLPNIVFILADDLGYGDIGALNPESKIPTPNFDRLAEGGMYFSDAHSYSGVCTPTRYGVLTGRYCFRTRLSSGVLGGHSHSLIEPGRETVATLLGKAGYRSGCIGKWHLGLDYRKKDPTLPLIDGKSFGDTRNTDNVDYSQPVAGGPSDHGFDYSYILPASLDMQPYVYIQNGNLTNTDLVQIEGQPQDVRGVFWRHGDAERDYDFFEVLPRFTIKAKEFIRDHVAGHPDQPFFLYFPLTAPHTPWMPTPEFEGVSGAGKYGDFVNQVDFTIGEVFNIIDSLGVLHNTLFMVSSDNGSHWKPTDIEEFGHLANLHFRGMKSDVWEGGHRVPFLAHWPARFEGGKVSDQLICLNDLLATFADLTGQSLHWNAGEDSFSFLGALTGMSSGPETRTTMINQSVGSVKAVRKDNWKLVMDMSSGGWSSGEITEGPPMQLYNLSNDISEQQNLYEEMPDKVEELQSLFDMLVHEGRSRFK